MSLTKKTYSVTKTKQLIDLNGDKVNFKLTFDIKSKNNEPYQTVVVNENNLQTDDELKFDYKLVNNGIISGEIVADTDVYQNYYLLIKADNPCECEVTLKIEDIMPRPPQPPPPPPPQPQQQPAQFIQPRPQPMQVENFELPAKSDTPNSFSSFNPLGSFNFQWKYVFYLVIAVAVCVGLYFYFNKKSDSPLNVVTSQPPVNIDEFKTQLPLTAPQTSRVSSSASSRASSKQVTPVRASSNGGLLEKLNRLKMEKNDL